MDSLTTFFVGCLCNRTGIYIEHLPIDAMDALRRINDFTGCPVVLCGLPDLLYKLRTCQRQYGYIYNRTSIPITLSELTVKGTEKLVSTMLESNVSTALWHKVSHGIGRDLKYIVRESIRVAGLNNTDVADTAAYIAVIEGVAKQLGRTYN